MNQTTETTLPSAPAWATSTTVHEPAGPDEWHEHTALIAELEAGWTLEAPEGHSEPMTVAIEAHRACRPDDLLPDGIRVSVPDDTYGGRYLNAADARRLAAALTLAANLLDGSTEVA